MEKIIFGVYELANLKTNLPLRAQNIQTINFFRQVLETSLDEVVVYKNTLM